MANLHNKLACLTLVSGLAVFSSLQASSNTPSGLHTHSFEGFTATAISKALSMGRLSNVSDTVKNGDLLKVNTSASPYSLHKHGPWLTDGGISGNSQELIKALKDARAHGLNPDSYELPTILATVKRILELDYGENTTDHLSLSELKSLKLSLRNNLNTQLNQAFLKLAQDLGRGAVVATDVQRQMFRKAPAVNPQEWLEALTRGEISAKAALQSLMPHDASYHRLTAHMRKLLDEHASGKRRVSVALTEDNANKFSKNDNERLTLRLMETGELPLNTELTGNYDQTLQFAIERFQQRNGIPVTGLADSRTRQALNLSVEKEIEAVALSLERWRWMPRILGQKHIMVNIPDYTVQVRKEGKTLLSMRTVVGKARHATPTFSEEMEYIVFNPTWTVPKSITNREMIPKELRNPGYLKSRNFDIMRRDGDHLVKVPYDEVTAEDYSAERFPYVLQQRSGPGNALGRMKFMMPNEYNIYLHDTQAKDLFSKNERAYSHGCIRLSDPETLARVLLQEDGFSEAEIETALTRTDRKLVRFKTPVPTHLTYMTTWVDEQGMLNMRPDIYKHDEALVTALEGKNTLIKTLKQVPLISSTDRQVSKDS